MKTLITELVVKALSKETFEGKITDERQMFVRLMENGLSGLVLPYISDTNRSQSFVTYKTQVLYDYATTDLKQQKVIELLRKTFQEHQIRFVFLKGTRVKKLYEHTYMRGMGDIDVLLLDQELQKAEKCLKELNINLVSRSLAHDLYETNEGVLIELHPRLDHEFNDKYVLFRNTLDYLKPFKGYEYTFDETFELLYLMYHLAKHFESSGVGLRSILDIGLYAKRYEENIDNNRIETYLIEMKMKRFYQVLLFLNKKLFQIETDLLDASFMIENDKLEALVDYIFVSGIHGKGSQFNPMAPRLSNSKNSKKRPFRVLLQTVFPSLKHMKEMYPILKKNVWLFPVFYLVRLFDLAVFRHKESAKKVKLLNQGEKERKKIEDIFDTLGLY